MGTLQIGLAIVGIMLIVTAVIFGIKKFANPSKIRHKYENSDERNNVFVKKYKEADIEYYRGPAARVGFIVVLVLLILVFNYSRSEKSEKVVFSTFQEEIIEQDIPVTKQMKLQEPPPPPPPPQIQVVEDEEIIESEPVFEEQEIDIDAEIEVFLDTAQAVKVEVPVTDFEPEKEEAEIFVVVEKQPEFPGGITELMDYLSKNITYPPAAQENGVQGTVVVRFVVDEFGGISAIEILRNIGGGCGDEAVRVVSNMPKWTPGRQRGRAVKVYYTLPVRFKLE